MFDIWQQIIIDDGKIQDIFHWNTDDFAIGS